METLLGIGIFVAIIVVMVWLGFIQQRKAAANLRAGAERIGLKFTPSAGIGKEGPRADGKIRGREARFGPTRPAPASTANTGSRSRSPPRRKVDCC